MFTSDTYGWLPGMDHSPRLGQQSASDPMLLCWPREVGPSGLQLASPPWGIATFCTGGHLLNHVW